MEIKAVEDKKQIRSLTASVGAIEQVTLVLALLLPPQLCSVDQEIVELATHVAQMESDAMQKQASLNSNRTEREATEHESASLRKQLEDGRLQNEELDAQAERERGLTQQIKNQIAELKQGLADQVQARQEKEAQRNTARRKYEEAQNRAAAHEVGSIRTSRPHTCVCRTRR